VEDKSGRLKIPRGSDWYIEIELNWVISTTREGGKDEEATTGDGKALETQRSIEEKVRSGCVIRGRIQAYKY
jgi:hypothetical protein